MELLRRSRTSANFKFRLVLLLFALNISRGFGKPIELEKGIPNLCSVLDNFEGSIEILESARTQLMEVKKKAGIPCDGWIVVDSGWAHVTHRNGYRVAISAPSFIQVNESNIQSDDLKTSSAFSLVRGQVFGQAPGGTGQLKILTVNGVVRVTDGAFFVLYQPEAEETQVVALDNKSTLENKFAPSKKMECRPGEASSLNFKLLRVVPSAPRAISAASLKEKLEPLNLPEKEKATYIKVAVQRAERKFASAEAPQKKDTPSSGKKGDYTRHPMIHDESLEIRSQFMKKMTSGEEEMGGKILFPKQTRKGNRGGSLELEQKKSDRLPRDQNFSEENEKKRIIDELNHVQRQSQNQTH